MRRASSSYRTLSELGQSLIETALVLPILLVLAFNAINFGYFFFVAVNIASAPRSGVQYSIVGYATPSQLMLPAAGPPGSSGTNIMTVSTLTYLDMQGVILPTGNFSNARVIVCTITPPNTPPNVGQRANCTPYGTGAETLAVTRNFDPEAPDFVLHEVDVYFQPTPLIPMPGPLGLAILPTKIHRQVSMRLMD